MKLTSLTSGSGDVCSHPEHTPVWTIEKAGRFPHTCPACGVQQTLIVQETTDPRRRFVVHLELFGYFQTAFEAAVRERDALSGGLQAAREVYAAVLGERDAARAQLVALATLVARLIDADGRVYQSGAPCEATEFTVKLRAAADAALKLGELFLR